MTCKVVSIIAINLLFFYNSVRAITLVMRAQTSDCNRRGKTMGRTFKHLTWIQRLQLESYLKAKLPVKEICKIMGVHNSTIYREIKRGKYQRLNGATWEYVDAYSPDIAQDNYELNKTTKGAPLKIGKDFEFAKYIEKRIGEDKMSPCAVLGEIKHNGMQFNTSICPTTLYSYIEKGVFGSLSLENLPYGKRKHRKRKVVAKRPPRGTSIEKRPEEINTRTTFGHWEMDCVCGPSKATLLVLTERLTRKEIIFSMKNQKSDSVITCLNALEGRFGKMFSQVFKTITVDNGSEFADFSGMEKSRYGKRKRVSIYYCHPYSYYERGSNERINREIRRKLPKGTDFSKLTQKDVQNVEDWLNNYPRKILGYATSAELFDAELERLRLAT